MHGRVPVKKLNMDARKGVVVTAPGDSDPQVPATGREQAVCPGSSSSDRKNQTLAVGKQAPGGGNFIATNTTVGGGAPQAPTGSLTAADITAVSRDTVDTVDPSRSRVTEALLASAKSRGATSQVEVFLTPIGGTKRKVRSPPTKTTENEDAEMSRALRKIWKAYQVVTFEAEVMMQGDDSSMLREALEDLRSSLDQVITSKGELRSPSQKRAKPELDPRVQCDSVESRDVSTETPCWWPFADPERRPSLSVPKVGHSGLKSNTGEGVAPKPPKPPKLSSRRRLNKAAGITPGGETVPTAVEVPATTAHSDSAEWTTVVRNRRRNVVEVPPKPKRRNIPDAATLVKRRTPATEAVTISRPREGKTFSEVMKDATSKVNLKELGVEVIKTRVSKAGAIVLELKAKEEADKLAASLEVAIGEDAVVSRPTRRTPVLVLDIPEWLSPEEVSRDITKADPDIEGTGVAVRDNLGGGRVARLDIPMAAASRLAQARVIQVGWSRCRIKLLEKKDSRCYRCQEVGHVAARCTAPERPKKCYGCNTAGHLVKECPRRKRAAQGPPAKEGG